ncbi:MAG: SAM-dependent methyltransferase [Actinobacteria bacterium]|nr:SAM-dependent methyltransferase [Actinomycetota bacterium]MCA1720416.1 SAM-dependent methyltransferase [Actinomycetota bacterium]
MEQALYGPGGFYSRERPAGHFRTSVTAGPLFASAVRELAGRVDEALGRPDPFDVVDVGTGGGELLAMLPDVPARWRLVGVDRHDTLPLVTGLLFANEWLDNVPLDVTFDDRLVEVAADGTERLGGPAPAEALAWALQWWPDRRRVEVGLTRDRAWADAVGRVERGLAVAVDYGHVGPDVRTTLTGYRDGREVPPVPDGSCDLTAHVAFASCAAGARLLRQSEALSLLGIASVRPDRRMAVDDPRGYLALLAQAGAAAELLDPRGLGAFGWIVHPVGIEDPLP